MRICKEGRKWSISDGFDAHFSSIRKSCENEAGQKCGKNGQDFGFCVQVSSIRKSRENEAGQNLGKNG